MRKVAQKFSEGKYFNKRLDLWQLCCVLYMVIILNFKYVLLKERERVWILSAVPSAQQSIAGLEFPQNSSPIASIQLLTFSYVLSCKILSIHVSFLFFHLVYYPLLFWQFHLYPSLDMLCISQMFYFYLCNHILWLWFLVISLSQFCSYIWCLQSLFI